MRRSLTITPENERRIQGFRATTLGLETPVDLDYTTATNMLVDLGFLTLERLGGLPEDSLVPLVPLPLEDVVRLLFEYIADAVIKDLVQDKGQWAEEFSKKNAGVELLRSLRNLSAFQPKKPPPEPPVKHMTVIAHSPPAKGMGQISRKS